VEQLLGLLAERFAQEILVQRLDVRVLVGAAPQAGLIVLVEASGAPGPQVVRDAVGLATATDAALVEQSRLDVGGTDAGVATTPPPRRERPSGPLFAFVAGPGWSQRHPRPSERVPMTVRGAWAPSEATNEAD
jgi:hypothetical protein